jgi:hypothetical protein
MPKKENAKFIVVKDTREQKGWEFGENEFCHGMVIGTLKTGDYSVQGKEDLLCIERKASTGEFASNIVDKAFERELERMRSFKYNFVILEFSIHDVMQFPRNSGIPPRTWGKLRITGNFMLKRIIDFQTRFNTKIIFADIYGEDVAMSIFKKVFYEKVEVSE